MRLMLLLLLLWCAAVPAAATTYEVGTSGPQTSSNTATVVQRYTFDFYSVTDPGLYVLIGQGTNYDQIWTQTSTTSVSSSPPGWIHTFPEGVWIIWEGTFPAGSTFQTTTTMNATAILTLNGLENDLASGSGDWATHTPRCQDNVPGLPQLMQSLETNVVAGTADTRYGLSERWNAWLSQNITYGACSFEGSDAQSVFVFRRASCAGFANLFRAGLLEASTPFNVGSVMGVLLDGSTTYPGNPGGTIHISSAGLHSWSVVDDGSGWVPFDPGNEEQGLVTLSRIHQGTYLDDASGSILTYSYSAGQRPSVTALLTVSGTTGNVGSYQAKRQRSPFGTLDVAAHWYKSNDLKPATDGPPTDVGNGPIVDLNKRNTFVLTPIPAQPKEWVNVQLYLEQDAHVTADVYDVRGRKLARVLDEPRRQGENWFIVDPDTVGANVCLLVVSLRAEGRGEVLPARKIVFVQ